MSTDNWCALLLMSLVSGCGGSKTTTPSEGSIAISINPTSATIEQGASASVTATLTRAGGFTGAVTIAVEGAPTGVTGAASNVQTIERTTTATITITAAEATVPGSYTLQVRGRGTGVTTAETSFALTVTAKPAYTLAVSPNALTIPQGGNATTSVAITRVNFEGAVTLSLGGAPTGVGGSFNAPAPTGTSSTLTVTVGATVLPGVYNLTVNGTATAGNQSAPLTLTVTAPPGFITLALSQPAVSIEQGQSGTSSLTINRTNFAGTVNLTSSGAPSGMVVSFNPTSTTGNTSVVTVAVAGSVAVGPQQVTIQAAGTGISSVTVVLTVTVTVTVTASRIAYALGDQAAIGGADPALQFNGLGGPITVTRQAVGDYTVTIPGFGGTASESRLPFVNALSSNDVACAPVSWTMIGAVVFDATVRVMCVNGFSGAAVDSRFLIFATGQQGLPGRFAFGGSGPVSMFPALNATITLPSASSWTSGTPPVRLKRTVIPTGIFAWMSGLPASTSLTMRMIPIIHTASVAGPRCFGFGELLASQPEVDIAVQCYAVPGGPAASVDAPFNVLMVEAGRSGRRFAAVVNNQPSNPLYVPSPNFARSSSGGAISITRNVAGVYKVRFPGLARPAGGREVVMMQWGQSGLQPQQRCVLEQIASTGGDLEADLRCYRDNGTLLDTAFIVVVIE